MEWGGVGGKRGGSLRRAECRVRLSLSQCWRPLRVRDGVWGDGGVGRVLACVCVVRLIDEQIAVLGALLEAQGVYGNPAVGVARRAEWTATATAAVQLWHGGVRRVWLCAWVSGGGSLAGSRVVSVDESSSCLCRRGSRADAFSRFVEAVRMSKSALVL